MAKPFYSLEEVASKLGKSADEVKGLVRDGVLREFRDSGKVFFKAEDVDKLSGGRAPAPGDSGEILLEPAEDAHGLDDSLPALIESSGGTSIIGLEASDDDRGRKGDTAVPRGGMRVFEEDELPVEADPMAKTTISAADDQVALDSGGSASGLMDIAREADDTSLGAELLDEIYPGEEDADVAAMKTAAPPTRHSGDSDTDVTPAAADADEVDDSGEVLAPVIVAAGDPAEGMFAGLLVGALLVVAVSSSVVAAVLQGFLPDYARFLTNGVNYWFFVGGSVVVVGLALLIGWFVGRASAGPRRR